MNSEKGWIWKGMRAASLNTGIALNRPGITVVKLRTAGNPTFIQTGYIPVTSLECYHCTEGHPVAWLVEALCYKLEGRGFDSR
jgi:hypothetical protein